MKKREKRKISLENWFKTANFEQLVGYFLFGPLVAPSFEAVLIEQLDDKCPDDHKYKTKVIKSVIRNGG